MPTLGMWLDPVKVMLLACVDSVVDISVISISSSLECYVLRRFVLSGVVVAVLSAGALSEWDRHKGLSVMPMPPFLFLISHPLL